VIAGSFPRTSLFIEPRVDGTRFLRVVLFQHGLTQETQRGPSRMLTDTVPVAGEKTASENDVSAVEAMIDEGGPVQALPTDGALACPTCGRPKRETAAECPRCTKRSRSMHAREAWQLAEQSAEERAVERARTAHRFRLYCVSCGRSTAVASPPTRPGRCASCGGTMLTEFEIG
jgi:ribosomal protein S27E